MDINRLINSRAPVYGKTFSLFGSSSETETYYRRIGEFANECVLKFGDARNLVIILRKTSDRKKYLSKQRTFINDDDFINYAVNHLLEEFSVYTEAVHAHLKNLSLSERLDSVLSAGEDQYHLYMLEIELTNRINKKLFSESGYKIAFLPHCLRDLSRNCLSAPNGIDYVCKACSKNCYLNGVFQILKQHGVDPYIWMNADLKSVLKDQKKLYGTVGVLGIACIPELVNGMRSCGKFDVPAIGIPLDANRCTRWMGEFHQNSVDLSSLEHLLNTN